MKKETEDFLRKIIKEEISNVKTIMEINMDANTEINNMVNELHSWIKDEVNKAQINSVIWAIGMAYTNDHTFLNRIIKYIKVAENDFRSDHPDK